METLTNTSNYQPGMKSVMMKNVSFILSVTTEFFLNMTCCRVVMQVVWSCGQFNFSLCTTCILHDRAKELCNRMVDFSKQI